jgi:hypothetical protein
LESEPINEKMALSNSNRQKQENSTAAGVAGMEQLARIHGEVNSNQQIQRDT